MRLFWGVALAVPSNRSVGLAVLHDSLLGNGTGDAM